VEPEPLLWRIPVRKLILPVLILAAVAVVLAGCGSSGGGGGASSSGGGGGTPTTGGSGSGLNGVAIGNCLNDQADFLVQPSESSVEGQSPAGVSFTLILYKTAAAAQAAAKKKNPKTTSVVDNGVIDFQGNLSPYAGAPPAKISQKELGDIKSCIESSK
jgi:hypothetical protein